MELFRRDMPSRLIRILRRQADEFIYGLKEFKDGKYVLYYSLSREDLKTEREMMFPCLRDLVDQELDRRELLEIRRRASDPAPRHLQEVR